MNEPRDKGHGRAVGVLAIIVIAGIAFSKRNEAPPAKREAAVADRNTALPLGSACIQRGIAYYKEIGSYPRLSDGRLADGVAVERC